MPNEGYAVKSGLEIYNNVTAGVKLTTQKGHSFIRFADNNVTSNLIIDADRGSTSSGSTELRLDIRQVNIMKLQTNKVTITQPLDVNGTVTATGLYAPGCVVQVLQAFKSDAFATQALIANGGEAITGLGVTITPKSASSKILVSFSVTGNGTDNVTQIYFKLRRGSTEIGNGNADAARPAATPVLTRAYFNNNNVACNINFQYLDAPNTTAATTYQLYVGSEGNSGTIFINRTHNQGNTVNNGPCSSSFTVMEIAG
jgi:hypothetical protein